MCHAIVKRSIMGSGRKAAIREAKRTGSNVYHQAKVAGQKALSLIGKEYVKHKLRQAFKAKTSVLNQSDFTSKYNRRTSLPRGRRIKAPAKRLRAINSRLPKGLSKGFHRKVTKSINFTGNWGLYISTSSVQLRQTVRDFKETFTADENAIPMVFGSPFEIMHAASVLFNQKTDTPTWTTTTGNLDDRIKVNLTSYYVTYFFKSTSSHVVNIEMFECTAKEDIQSQSVTVVNYIQNSYGDFQSNYTTLSGAVAMTEKQLNSVPAEWVELHDNFVVKRRTFKIQPGDYASCTVKICGNKVLDFSKCSENGTLLHFHKGFTKQVWFRVINDPTVSTTSNTTPTAGANAGDVHHWPSNTIGGVACEFTKHIKMAAMPNPSASNANHAMANSIKRSNWLPLVSDALDQQVVINNPISTTNIG